MPPKKKPGRRSSPAPVSPREQGLRAFQAGRFDAAITNWAPLVASDAAVKRAFCEALLRRALTTKAENPEDDLRRAIILAPNDPRFSFHLGRLLHRAGRLDEAAKLYRFVLSLEPSHRPAARLLALLTLQQDHSASLAALPGMSEEIQAWAAPAQALLSNQPPPDDDSPLGTFWRGLGMLMRHRPDALKVLSDERLLPVQSLAAQRDYYRGAAEALAGDNTAALERWGQLFEQHKLSERMVENFAALLAVRLSALLSTGKTAVAGELAWRWWMLPGTPALDELRVQALDAVAHKAAAAGDWRAALERWEAARFLLTQTSSLGSPRPILHNIALVCERVENWEGAADAWRALLRTRRRGADEGEEAKRWAWVRERVIECYRRAGRPDEAVTVFRQALKADPNDLELRIQLADALYANEQERAAYNEIQRILQIDPYYPEAVLRQADYLTGRYQLAEAQALARELAERHPTRADIRARVGQLFLEHGRAASNYGNAKAAYDLFVEGERYAPNEPRFALNQARMLKYMGKSGDSAGLVERALGVGGESNETWILAIETWQIVDDLEAARALIARFERERTLDADDFLDLGFRLMTGAMPPPQVLINRFAPSRPTPPDTAWTKLALEQIERGVALRPNDRRTLLGVASFMLLPRPQIALDYATQAVALNPDDIEALIVQGVATSLCGDVAQAKAILSRAEQGARKQGRPDLRAQAQELRRVVGTPVLQMMLSSAFSAVDDLDDADELYFD